MSKKTTTQETTEGVKVSVKVESYAKELKATVYDAAMRGLKSVGMESVTLTHRQKEQGGTPVDTGRLRNSIAWAVGNSSGGGSDGTGGGDKPLQAPEDWTLAIGSNVEYAQIVEEGGGKRKPVRMLRNAITDISTSERAGKIITASIDAALDD